MIFSEPSTADPRITPPSGGAATDRGEVNLDINREEIDALNKNVKEVIEDKKAFYDALADRPQVILSMGDATLRNWRAS